MKGVFVVQNKQKSNKINIAALITCFMLILVFVFGSVQFAFAADNPSIAEMLSKYDGDKSCYIAYTCTIESKNVGSCSFVSNYSGKICAYLTERGEGILSDHSFDITWFSSDFKVTKLPTQHPSSDGITYYSSSGISRSYTDIQSTMLLFSSREDAKNYIQTGEINNPIFTPTVYDENIPTPANISLTFNCEFGDSFKLEEIGHPFTMTWDNVQPGDNQINYDDLTFECYVDMGYWAYKDIFGHHDDKTTGKIKLFDSSAMSKYKTCDKLGKNSDWDTWFSKVKLDIKAFGMLGQYYDFYCRYVDSSGNYGNWVKIHVSGSNSTINRKWGVIKDIDASTTVNKGYEEINGDSGEHVSGDYDNYYVGTPDGNLSNNLTSLKSNYSNLVSFYKELFSFLPAEIWIILVGLVSTMVVIAIIKFVRG